jgi:hypothetical protein
MIEGAPRGCPFLLETFEKGLIFCIIIDYVCL